MSLQFQGRCYNGGIMLGIFKLFTHVSLVSSSLLSLFYLLSLSSVFYYMTLDWICILFFSHFSFVVVVFLKAPLVVCRSLNVVYRLRYMKNVCLECLVGSSIMVTLLMSDECCNPLALWLFVFKYIQLNDDGCVSLWRGRA